MAENIVTSVNGQTGEVTLKASNFGLKQETWSFTNMDMVVEEQQVVIHTEIVLITFIISGTTYQAEEGMTWAEWLSSDYNIDSYVYHYGVVPSMLSPKAVTIDGETPVEKPDLIIANHAYTLAYVDGAGGWS